MGLTLEWAAMHREELTADWVLCQNKIPSSEDSASGVIPRAPWRVVSVRVRPGYCLVVMFVDGTEGEVDMSKLVHDENAGVFRELADPQAFSKAFVLHGVVTWPTGQDLAPDVMHDEIARNGRWFLR